jgi:hypothetical protein
MKIQNHCISMSASHKEVQAKQIGFSAELDTQSRLRIDDQEGTTRKESATDTFHQLRYKMLQQLIEFLHGLYGRPAPTPTFEPMQFKPMDTITVTEQRFSFTEQYSEFESIDVAMQGKVQTDSQCIDIDIALSMSRTFVAEHKIDITAQFYDPLVINLDGELPALSEKKFAFDIDNDGECDQISCLDEGSAFLALDANENGCIDDGNELFGTITGNGFKELARHDSDENGWIDANDPVLDKLRVWHKTPEGSELVGLGEAGVGAIYLGYADSPFTYKTDEQESLGRLRSTGFFLQENGQAGTVAQIDFAREQKPAKPSALQSALASV